MTVTLAPRPRPVAAARRLAAEAFGTFWLVVGGCGAAVLAAGTSVPGSIGLVGISLAFGLTVFTMAFAVGFISGGHFNPAVSVGLAVAGRFAARDLPGYIAAQLVGATLGAAVVAAVASGVPGFDLAAGGLAANGYGAHSPGGYDLASAFLVEALLTAGFLIVILGATDARSPAQSAAGHCGSCGCSGRRRCSARRSPVWSAVGSSATRRATSRPARSATCRSSASSTPTAPRRRAEPGGHPTAAGNLA